MRWFAWRRHRRGPVQVRESRHVELAPNPSGDGLFLAVNPGAGSSSEETADSLRTLLPEAEIVALDDPGDLETVLRDAAQREDVTALGASGGDGTLSCAAGIAAERGIPLVAIPGGTLNHLAQDLGLTEAEDTVEAVRAGKAVEVDVASIDGRTFLNTASFGAYTELVDTRESLEGRIGKWPAVLVAGWRVLRGGTPIDVEVDGRRYLLWMIFIGNCRYEPDGFAPSRRARLDDGQLDIRMIVASHPWCRTRLVLGLLTGRLGRSPVYKQWASTALVVRSLEGRMRLAADGETFDGGDCVEVVKDGRRLALYTAETTAV
jgi:undecaprenyl-diphosphatase